VLHAVLHAVDLPIAVMVLRSDCVVHTCGCVFVSLTIADNSLSISFHKSGLVSAAIKWADLQQNGNLDWSR